MKVLKRFSIILALGVSMLLSACSKTVQWEEEVPLNTGEVIWVKRTVVYTGGIVLAYTNTAARIANQPSV